VGSPPTPGTSPRGPVGRARPAVPRSPGCAQVPRGGRRRRWFDPPDPRTVV